MKHKRISIIILCMILVLGAGLFSLTGCTKKPAAEGPDTENPSEKTYRVALFYANEEYVASGDEAIEKFKVYETELSSVPEKVYMETLELLRNSPDKGYDTMLGDQIKLNRVYAEGDTAFVDLGADGLSGGSMEELYLISQIVDTLINSFEEIKQVQFLVDGKVPETLMGHVGTEDPFTKDAFAE
ncbi:GerMN domain-containing protein [Anoxybacterium hadale]|uniref:GerMN domain-containing protein n=1 Tax=Anoxybacterium hadale TaxID=3408580 RepID=A0ACD1ADH3_9FIRM|nr:GerMN domain-containing protein [Clostridiales bacterium]